jgi:hypothetical protein
MHIVISLFKIHFQLNLNLNMASKAFTLATKLCEARNPGYFLQNSSNSWSFSKDELHIILKLTEFTLQYHN